MGWPQSMQRGALLAARVADDAALERGGPGLLPAATAELQTLGAELSAGTDRRQALKSLAQATRPMPSIDASLSPRARAIIAAHVPRDVGQRWLDEAPRARRGFRPTAGLALSTARAATVPEKLAETSDRGEGRALMAAATKNADDDSREHLLSGCSAEEAAAILALAAHSDEWPAPPAAFLRAALTFEGDERVDALGALARGARERSAHHADPIARAGRELGELFAKGEA